MNSFLKRLVNKKVVGFTVGLGVASPLDIHVAVKLEKLHFAVALKDKREINFDRFGSDGIAILLKILSTRHLVDKHLLVSHKLLLLACYTQRKDKKWRRFFGGIRTVSIFPLKHFSNLDSKIIPFS